MNIPLTFGNYKGRSGAANAMELVNMFAEADSQGGAAPYVLHGTPGCLEYVDIGRVGEGRGGYSIPGKTFVVVNKYLYLVDTTNATKQYVGELSTSIGTVQWAENPDQLMLIDGLYGYVITKANNNFKKITDADFPTPKACAFKDGYGVVVESSTGKFYVSAINDFTSWDALSFATAEFEPDNLVGCISTHDSLFAFGVTTTQPYYNSGNSSFPFDNRPGANMTIGCGATNSPARGKNLMFWLDENGIVRQLDGYSQSTISTPQIAYMISNLSDFSDAKGFVYTQDGHTFYVLVFPTGKLTLVYDATTGNWHKRTSYANDGRWRPSWITSRGNRVFAGDYSNGKVYQLSNTTFTDNGEPIRWFFTLQNVNSDNKMVAHDKLEIEIESGVGLVSGQGSDPKLWMQYSDDGGKTWSTEKWRSMGKIGEFKRRVRFYNLGRARSRVYRIGGADPVKRCAIDASLEGRVLGY